MIELTDKSILTLIQPQFALKNKILPLEMVDDVLHVAVTNPGDVILLKDIMFATQKKVKPIKYDEEDIRDAITRYYNIKTTTGQSDGAAQDFSLVTKSLDSTSQMDDFRDDVSIIKKVNEILTNAIHTGASDIHFEPYEKVFRVRYRKDGKLIEAEDLQLQKKAAFISRLKIMADLDIAERRRPQDGRIRMEGGEKVVDIRVSTMPTDFGEKVVLRLLDKSAFKLDIENIGFTDKMKDEFIRALNKPHGIILVTGPTGSGKTTTLYTALNHINKPDVNILTIEDPIEYNLAGINQAHVRADIGFTFASALRSFLRQDPDVIMVGEIRDGETAEIAIRSALTGHLVLSTLHTNDAPSSVTRLIEMGVKPFLVASSLRIVMAQRLIRVICRNCKTESEPDKGLLKLLGLDA